MTLWRTLLAWLAALSADPVEIDREHPRAAAAVAAAYAAFAPADPEPAPPPPAPAPAKCACGGKCANGVYRPDGRIEMRCEKGCPCGCQKKPPSPAPSR